MGAIAMRGAWQEIDDPLVHAVVLRAGYPEGIGVDAATAAAIGVREGERVVFPRYFMALTMAGMGVPSMSPWFPTPEDLLAEDWDCFRPEDVSES